MNQLRNLWWVPGLLVASALFTVGGGAPGALGQGESPDGVIASAPDWSFVVHGMQDPYAGVLTAPQEPANGMRYVGFDVEVVNASEQPLHYASDSVSVRDDAGFSYRSGTVAGGEPALPGRTMPGGERARGWVWFEVPEDATLTEIVLVPSAPELEVGLDAVASIPGTTDAATRSTSGGTPTPEVIATEPAPPTVTPPPAETPAAATSTPEPVAPQAPTSVIIIEGAETPAGEVAETPVPTPAPAATATPAIVTSAPTEPPPAVESGIEPGSTVVTGDSDANLRGGPSLDAEVIGTIPLGSELAVTGPAVAGDDFIWVPVLVVATGEEGYVAEELLSPVDE